MKLIKINKWDKQDKNRFFLGTFFVLITSCLSSMMPFLLKFATDFFETGNNNNEIIFKISMILLIMIVIGMLSIIFNYLSKIFLIKLSTKKVAQIRQEMFDNIQIVPPSNLKQYDSSSLISRLSLDIFNYSLFYNYMLINVFPSIIRWFVFTIVTFAINYLIGFSLIILCLILFFVSMLMIKNSTKHYQYSIENIDNITKVITENIVGIRIVKSFNLEKKQLNRFEKFNQDIVFHSSKADIKTLLPLPFSITIINSVGIIVLLIASGINFNSFDNKVEYGEIVAIISYSYLILWSIFDVVYLYIYYSRSYVSQKRIKEILDLKLNIENEFNKMPFINGDIEFKNVYFKYMEQTNDFVLEDINFKIKKNSKIGIIGPTGSGKTTLLYLITKFWNPSKGEVTINDVNIKDIETKKLLKNMSFAFQNKLLFSGTIKENLEFSNNKISLEQINNILEMCQLKNFIDIKKEGIEYRLEESGQNLSGGQKQRINIARTLARKANIYIFDDATSALDNITEKKILSSIMKLKNNSTLIVASQKISTIENMDQIIVLDKGKISGIGNHNYLLQNNKIYQEIYEIQNKKRK